jgi:hypothetical protein
MTWRRRDSVKQLALLALCLLPLLLLVYRIRKGNLKDTLLFLLMILIYIVTYRDFVFGKHFVFHDTLYSHHVYYVLVEQWLRSGYDIGWNPFMNGGEPLYIYTNYFLWAEFVLFCLINKMLNLPVHSLINIYFTYILISYFTFSFILFSLIFRERSLVFFPTAVLIFSGITLNSMGQYIMCTLYFLPLVLACLYLYSQARNMGRKLILLLWIVFFVCVSTNHYFPHYLLLCVISFLFFDFLTSLKWSKSLPPHYPGDPGFQTRARFLVYASVVLVLSFLVLLPFFKLFREINSGYISPTRGSAKLGAVKDFSRLVQPGVDVSPDRYKYLLTIPVTVNTDYHSWGSLEYYHGPYYIGHISVVFAVLSLLLLIVGGAHRRYYLVCLLTLAVLVYLSMGSKSAMWIFLINHVPYLYLRHSYPLAHAVCLLLIIISTFGLSYAIRRVSIRYLITALAIVISLMAIYRSAHYESREKFDAEPFSYPRARTFYSGKSFPIPFDTAPLVYKQATASHPSEDFMFFRRITYDDLLKSRPRSIPGDLISFSDSLEEEHARVRLQDKQIDLATRPFQYTQGGRGGKAEVREGELLHLNPSTSGNSMIRYELEDLEPGKDKWVSLSPSVRSSNKTPDAVQVDLQDGVTAPTVASYGNSGGWEKLEAVKFIGRDSSKVYVSFNVRHDATAPAIIAPGKLGVETYGSRENVPIEYMFDKDPNHLTVAARIPRDGYLIRRENHHPGWRAYMDSRNLEIVRFLNTFQAVRVCRGHVRIDFVFQSNYMRLMWIHVLCVFLGYIMFFGTLVGDPQLRRQEMDCEEHN